MNNAFSSTNLSQSLSTLELYLQLFQWSKYSVETQKYSCYCCYLFIRQNYFIYSRDN